MAFFGTATELARHEWIFLLSLLFPLGLAIYVGIFLYRHTARRRKTQATLSVLLTLILVSLTYFIALRISPQRFRVSRAHNFVVR
jgi:ABC-type proline/glycine betaine transport system permease subunit